MAVQRWIRILIVALTTFNFSNAAIRSPESSPTGKFIDEEWWKAPPRESEESLCDPEEMKQNSPITDKACTIQCQNLSRRAEIVFKMYGNTRATAKTVSRQCSGFIDGTCRSHFIGYFPLCWCRAKDFQQMSFLCEKVLLEWARIFLNTKTRFGYFYDASIKPIMGSAKDRVAYLWDSIVRPRLPVMWARGGSLMPGTPKIHGAYPSFQGQFENDEVESVWFPQEESRLHSPIGSKERKPMLDEGGKSNIQSQFEHDELELESRHKIGSRFHPPAGSKAGAPTLDEGRADKLSNTQGQLGLEDFTSKSLPRIESKPHSSAGSEIRTPVPGQLDGDVRSHYQDQFKHGDKASEWPLQKGNRSPSPTGQSGAKTSANDDFLNQLESDLGLSQNGNTCSQSEASMHDQSGGSIRNDSQYQIQSSNLSPEVLRRLPGSQELRSSRPSSPPTTKPTSPPPSNSPSKSETSIPPLPSLAPQPNLVKASLSLTSKAEQVASEQTLSQKEDTAMPSQPPRIPPQKQSVKETVERHVPSIRNTKKEPKKSRFGCLGCLKCCFKGKPPKD